MIRKLILIILLLFACGEVAPVPDTEDTNYIPTPIYGIQVNNLAQLSYALTKIDMWTEEFFKCQFDTNIPPETETPLNEMRVLILDADFECETPTTTICRGVWYPKQNKIIFNYYEGKSIYKHELAHKYGMDHTIGNEYIYEDCINSAKR